MTIAGALGTLPGSPSTLTCGPLCHDPACPYETGEHNPQIFDHPAPGTAPATVIRLVEPDSWGWWVATEGGDQ
ncbi:hypothetical protein ACFYNO_25060 [Kitasatospora sp. NPDC006697]|uniref:hypothetical protein n=1 Tax=Kitasatospora sp. NPDC006697 TaxID=3364020 RepID=UPI0036C4D20C